MVIVCDYGLEFTGEALFFWSKQTGLKPDFIQLGKQMQNVFVESFNGKIREQCLNLHWFRDLEDARRTNDDWREYYDEVRLHRLLNDQAPAVFAKQAA